MPTRAPVALRAADVVSATGGQLVAGRADAQVGRVSIDSRRVTRGDLFVAIRGDRLDGHAFVVDALGRGATGVIVSDVSAAGSGADGASGGPFVISVPDTTHALQRLGQFVRRASGTRVVAVTGSVGKTTTKELTAAVLASQHDVFRTVGNLNNHIGLPLSLIELRRRPEVAVLELGMNHAGEIRTLVDLAEPEHRVWTNVAEVHSEFFDSVEDIADAKAEILESATEESGLVANAADDRVMGRIWDFPGRVTTFGIEVEADVRATEVRSLGLAGMEATVRTPAGSGALRTPLLGEGNVANVLAAVAVACQFQIPLELVLSRLADVKAEAGRGQVLYLGDVTVVDDSYNSNPLALDGALTTVGQVQTARRRIAVLGEMLELGQHSDALHRQSGRAVVEAGFDLLFAVGGPAAHALADGAIAAGLPGESVSTFATSEDAAGDIVRLIEGGDVVLVKGSRGVRTDRVVDRLVSELG